MFCLYTMHAFFIAPEFELKRSSTNHPRTALLKLIGELLLNIISEIYCSINLYA